MSKSKWDVNMGDYMPTEEEWEAYRWCIRNDIKISPFAEDRVKWWIDIVIGDKASRSPTTYRKTEIWEKIFEFYIYYFNKNNL